MDKSLASAITAVVDQVVSSDAIRATKYISPKLTVRVTRPTYKRNYRDKANHDLRLHIGRPNYAERLFIKQCVKAGVPFPVRKVQVKFRAVR